MTIKLGDILAWKYKSDDGYAWFAADDATYDSIEWRCALPKPTEAQFAADAIEYETYLQKIAYIGNREEEYQKQRITFQAMTEALWESIANDSHDKKLDLKSKIDKINQDNPPPA